MDKPVKSVKATTDAFCKAFAEEADFQGSFALAVGQGFLPQGVDPTDPRVIEIMRKCAEPAEKPPETAFTD